MTTTTATTLRNALARDLDAAFPDLVRALQNGIYSGALRLTRHPQDAEDVTQEAFVRAYRALNGYDDERIRELRLRSWVWTIALNLCRNTARRKTRKPTTQLSFDRPDAVPGPEEAALSQLASEEWDRRLARLSTPQRTAVVLRHVADLSYAEIAEATGRPIGTVKADAHRGIARLRAMTDEEGTRP
jgi:RNA polymerase sigma-70 factor (ECF subfamily)